MRVIINTYCHKCGADYETGHECDPAILAANTLDRAALIDAAREAEKLETETE